jgi:hypothetical protein
MREFDGAPIANAPATSQRLSDIRVSIPAEILAYPELRIPNAAAQTRIVSKARIRLDSGKSVRSFKGIICADISEIAVGTLITERPPHRTERAQFGHSAPTSGA